MTTTLKFRVSCLEGKEGCTVHFEPEGAEIEIPAGGMLRVEMTGEDDDELEISYVPGGVVIGAWNRATTKVWDRGGTLVEPRQV